MSKPSLFWHCLPLHGAVPSGPSLAALWVTETRAGSVCETAGGACALPFTFDGVEHHSCAGVGAEAWCSLTPIFQGQRADCPSACLSEGTLVLVTPELPSFVLRYVSTCSARRRAGFMSSGPATAALSYALLIACASMPLLLPISYVAVKLHERRFIPNKKPDGIEMEIRDASKIDAIPRQLHASQVEADLSKARTVPVVAYFCRASGMGRARYYFVHVCAYMPAGSSQDAEAEDRAQKAKEEMSAIRTGTVPPARTPLTNKHTHACMHARTHARARRHASQTRARAHTHSSTHTHSLALTHTHAHTNTHSQTQTHTRSHTRARAHTHRTPPPPFPSHPHPAPSASWRRVV